MEKREKLIVRASWVSIGGNALLSVLKIIIGFLAGSLAVVADGIDSAGDIIASVITLFTAHVITRPPNLKYAYGYERADSIASKVLAFIVFFAGAQLAISTVHRLMENVPREMPSFFAIYVTIASIAGKTALAWYQSHVGKKTGSLMLQANGRNMLGDVIISVRCTSRPFLHIYPENAIAGYHYCPCSQCLDHVCGIQDIHGIEPRTDGWR